MEIQQQDDGLKGKFYIQLDNQEVAQMSYVWAGNESIIIEHTEVNDVLKGKGAGKQLLMQAVAFARQKGIKIVPICSFVKSVIEKSEDLQDVL